MSETEDEHKSESVVVWIERLLLMLFVLTPFTAPLAELIEQLGFILGVSSRQIAWAPAVIAAPIAGLLVAYNERRYGSILLAGFLTLFGWLGLMQLSGLSTARVYGDPWLFVGELFMYVSVASLAVVVVFYIEWREMIWTGI